MNMDQSFHWRAALILATLAGPCATGAIAAGEAAAAQSDGRVLPYSRGRRFATLDEYLRHLRSNAAIDLPYYREVRPGFFEEVSSFRPLERGRTRARLYTRRELMRMFGFSR